ncbi:CRE-PLX-2 protein [Aphelenchoides avenae]|nr:CRE-PLX-2 protein [Aphelenchus avenae]
MYLLAIDIRCFFLLSWLIAVSAEASSRVVATFRSGSSVNNVLVANDKVYVGAVNRLYCLHATNLSLIDEAVTGPVLDSPLCNPELTSCVGPRSSIVDTDNYNKILQVLPGTDGILACGSVRQGICEIRDAGNLRRTIRNSTVPVAANSANASTVSLLGKDSERIYVAATYSYDTPYREGFPAIATRLTSSLLPINSGSIEGEAAVYIRAEYRTRFRVQYIAAFLDEHYVYFATVQNKYVQAPSIANPTVSRLVRVCQNDDKYVSYSEIEIQCRGDDNALFGRLQALVRVDEELIGIFTDSDGRRSAICIFQLPKIRLTFFYNIDRCRAGTDTIGLPHIGRDSKCFNKSHLPLAEDTCQLGVGGAIEASQVAAVQYKDRVLRCLDARVVNEHTLVLLGTDAGEIMQVIAA